MNTDKFLNTPTLYTDRLILRKLEITDAEDVFDYGKQPAVSKYMSWDKHKSINDSINYIEFTINRYENGDAGEWAIILKETGKLIGAIGFVRFEEGNFCGEIGYALSKDYWSQGIMTEALKRIIKFSFEDMRINRVVAIHAIENPASGKVMQKANMQFEGILKQRYYAKEKFWDTKQYAIVKSDWINIDDDLK